MVDVLTKPKTATPWLPYQREWMNDDSAFKVAEKSRRIGWTYVEAYDAVSQRFRKTDARNMDYWFSSADESAAREFIEYCEFFSKMFGAVAKAFEVEIPDNATKRNATAFCIRCPNDKRITAMSSSPRRFRSKGGDVCLDEFGYHDDPRAMYKAAKPSTMRGGRIRAFSTHNGEEALFNQFCKHGRMIREYLKASGIDLPPHKITRQQLRKAARALKVPAINLHSVTLVDAVEQGLVENINQYSKTNFTRDEFIEDCRQDCIDDEMWAQEFMCIPSIGSMAILSYDLIEQCERDVCRSALGDVDLDAIGSGPLFLGWDIARRRDLSVLWLLEQVGDELLTRGLIEMKKTSFRDQLAKFNALMKLGVRHACIDATGMGEMPAEEAVLDWGTYRVEPVMMSASSQVDMAFPLRSRFEDGSIGIPEDRELREDLHRPRRPGNGNTMRIETPRGKNDHADRFWALALAVRASASGATAWDGSMQSASSSTRIWTPGQRDDEPTNRRDLLKV